MFWAGAPATDTSGLQGEKTPLRTLFGTLDAIAEQCRLRREPPLHGLVRNDDGLPGKGYFEKHCFLRFDPDTDNELAEQVYETPMDDVRK